jgi:hypothetical protein
MLHYFSRILGYSVIFNAFRAFERGLLYPSCVSCFSFRPCICEELAVYILYMIKKIVAPTAVQHCKANFNTDLHICCQWYLSYLYYKRPRKRKGETPYQDTTHAEMALSNQKVRCNT